jgi:hypothetical protein
MPENHIAIILSPAQAIANDAVAIAYSTKKILNKIHRSRFFLFIKQLMHQSYKITLFNNVYLVK